MNGKIAIIFFTKIFAVTLELQVFKLITSNSLLENICIDDVSAALKLIIDRQRQPEKLSGIFHCTASERTTKYTLALMMAEILGVPSAHLVADSEPPAGAPRPQNTQLDPSSLWAAVGSEVKFTPLRDGLAKALEAHKASFASVD